jgi:Protein kinase domain
MGAVYRGRHHALGVVRAIKVLSRTDWDARALARFEREVQTLAAVTDPRVVRIHEAGVDSGRPWFAMELVEGEELADRLGRGRLPLDEGLRLAEEVCRGVQALHARGIVHRDLKPPNVLLARPDDRPVILDLGLAVAPDRDERLTRTGAMMGTLHYMAPEQFKGQGSQPQTDVYALGLIAFEILVGVPAVDRDSSAHEVMGSILNERRPRPSSLDPDLPHALDRVLGRATDRDLTRRFADAGQLADALARVRERPWPAARTVRRRRAASALGTLGLVCLAALTVPEWLDRQTPAVTDREGPEATSPPPSPQAPVELTPAQAAAARAEVHGLRERPPEEQLRVGRAWLERYPTHPDHDQILALVEAAQREVPSLELLHARTPGEVRACFVDDTRALTWGEDGRVALWDLGGDGRAPLREWSLEFPLVALALTPDRESFLVGGLGPRLEWSALSGERLGSFAPGWDVLSLAVRPDGGAVAVGGRFEYAAVFALPSGEQLHSVGTNLAWIRGVGWARDGELLVCLASSDPDVQRALGNSARVWAPVPNQQTAIVLLTSRPLALGIGPRPREFVVGTDSGELSLLDVDGGGQGTFPAGVTRPAHPAAIRGVAYHPDGLRVFSVSSDRSFSHGNQLRAWSLDTREPLGPLRERPHPLLSVDVAPGGAQLVLGSTSGVAEVWPVAPPE